MSSSLRHALILTALLVTPAALRAEEGFPARYLVLEIDAQGEVTPLYHRRIRLASPLRSRTAGEMEELRQEVFREDEGVEVRVLDDSGQTVFQDVLRVPQWVRGEFHGAREARGGWAIEAHNFPWDPRVFVVRAPATGTLLSLGSLQPGRETFRAVTLDLEDLERRADLLPIAMPSEIEPQQVSGVITGNPGNRVDLLIMGDGYTAAQIAKFNSDTANLEASFFNLSPYSEYKNYVNRVTLFTASAQSGADHPPYNPACSGDNPSCCSDIGASFDPLAGTYVNTAFGGRFCAFNTHRLAVVNTAAAYAAASAYPDWDAILVLLNDATYGGSGGAIAVTSTHTAAVDIARHEYGHSFTRLGDEYETPNPGYPGCSDISGPACQPNVTDQTSRPLIKWAPWISASTPIPTPEGIPAYANVAGLFQGARYQSAGMYRHRDTECLMNFLGKPFGEVCRQEYVLRLYRGGWGDPFNGIELVEPASELPPEGSYSVLTGASFAATLLGPSGGPPLSVTWKINGAPVPGATGSSFTFLPPAPGSYQVTLEVRDATSLVHPAMAGSLLQTSRSWWITNTPSPASDFYTLAPCRVLDTRNAVGPYGGPALAAGATRSFVLTGRCGIPADARAVSANLTVAQATHSGYLATYAGGSPPPLTSSIAFAPGETRSNNVVLSLALDGSGTLVVRSGSPGAVHVVLDVNGFFR